MIRMGAVKRPRLDKNVEELLKDLSPEVREAVKKMMTQHHGEELNDRLEKLIGMEKTRRLIERK